MNVNAGSKIPMFGKYISFDPLPKKFFFLKDTCIGKKKVLKSLDSDIFIHTFKVDNKKKYHRFFFFTSKFNYEKYSSITSFNEKM